MCKACEHIDSEIKRYRALDERISALGHLYGKPTVEGVKRILHELEARREALRPCE